MHRTWTISSDHKVEALEFNVPGVVFVGRNAGRHGPRRHLDRCWAIAEGDVVTEIVVTSETTAFLENMEIISLEVEEKRD